MERDGERWREMERDGERWREMDALDAHRGPIIIIIINVLQYRIPRSPRYSSDAFSIGSISSQPSGKS